MIEETIKMLEELEAKATPGLWDAEYVPGTIAVQDYSDGSALKISEGGHDDLKFASAMQNNFDALIQAARENIRLRKALGDIKASALGLRCENKCPGLFIFMVEKALNDQEGK